ncbi:MAG: ABC transporter substrate-binding protein [Granulosicoccus sp.]|nr:ABC transporter substrate-binding protein [Granulosicoccus sp.]
MQFRNILRGVTIAFAVIATTGSAQAADPTPGGTLNFAVVAGPPTYDLHSANSFSVIHYLAPHYSTLLTFDWENYPKLEGDLAESWTVSDDQLTYTFKLHEGVKFHNGAALTAADVVASYDRLRAPPEGVVSVRQSQFSDIESIEATDETTVVFNMARANSTMLMVFGSPWNAIYSAADLASDPRFPETNVNGTGPFKFVEHIAGSRWVGEKNNDYFLDGKPYLDGFVASQIAGKALVNVIQGKQAMTEFRGIAPPQKKQLEEAMGDEIKFLEGPRLTNWLFAINTTKAPFDDKRVRQALNLAIDRCDGLKLLSEITLVLPNMATVLWPDSADALTAEQLAEQPGYSCDIESNRKKAMALLKEAGHEKLSFTLTNRAIPHPYDALGIYVLDQWQRIGLQVDMDSLPTSNYSAARKSGQFDVIMDFAPEFADSAAMNWGKYISFSKSPANFARYEDAELDALFDTVKYSSDAAEQKAASTAFQQRMLDEAYYIFLSYSTRIVPMDPSVNGWVFSPSHTLNQSLRDVWIEQ